MAKLIFCYIFIYLFKCLPSIQQLFIKHLKNEKSNSHSVMFDSLRPHGLAHQVLLSMEFSRQEYCSGLPCASPRDLPNLGTEPESPALQADSLPSEPPGKTLLSTFSVLKTSVKSWDTVGKARPILNILGRVYWKDRWKHMDKKITLD